MKRLTKIKAIKECKDMWAKIEKLDTSKTDFLYSTDAGEELRHKDYIAHCPLCQYATQIYSRSNSIKSMCQYCPLMQQFGKSCGNLGFSPFDPCPEFWSYVSKLKLK